MSRNTQTSKVKSIRFFNPVFFLHYFWMHRDLIKQLCKRDFQARYKGSFLGFFWAILNPLLMLAVYTFVFSVVFKGKWGIEASNNKFEFAIILFSGLSIFSIFTESVNKSPSLLIGNANFVKKVVFPLEVLPIVTVISSLLQSLISFVILIIAVNIFIGFSSWGIILCIFSILPMIMLTLGLSFIISALGVYIKDISYSIIVLTNILVYLTPVFYPLSVVPEFIQRIMYLNPLTPIVENFRNSIVLSQSPFWGSITITLFISYFIMVLGLIIFKKLSSGFADIL